MGIGHTQKISIWTTGEASVAGVTVWVWYLDWQKGKDKWKRQG